MAKIGKCKEIYKTIFQKPRYLGITTKFSLKSKSNFRELDICKRFTWWLRDIWRKHTVLFCETYIVLAGGFCWSTFQRLLVELEKSV